MRKRYLIPLVYIIKYPGLALLLIIMAMLLSIILFNRKSIRLLSNTSP